MIKAEKGNYKIVLSTGEELSVRDLLGIDEANCSKIMMEHPHNVFLVALHKSELEFLEDKARLDVKEAEFSMKFQHAKLCNDIREGKLCIGTKLTEASINEAATINRDYTSACQIYMTASKKAMMKKRDRNFAEGLLLAMEHKKTMLNSLSANWRKEIDSELRILERKFESMTEEAKGKENFKNGKK